MRFYQLCVEESISGIFRPHRGVAHTNIHAIQNCVYLVLCWQTLAGPPACLEGHRHKGAESTHKGLITRTFSTQGLLVHLEKAADLTWRPLARRWMSEQQQHLFADVHVRCTARHLCTDCMTTSSFLPQFGVFCRGCLATGGTWHVDRANRLLPSCTSAHLCWQNTHFSLQNQSQFHRPRWKPHLTWMMTPWHEMWLMRTLKLGCHYKDQLNQFLFCCYAECSTAVLEFTRLESLKKKQNKKSVAHLLWKSSRASKYCNDTKGANRNT